MNQENSTPTPPHNAETIIADYLLSYSGDFGTLDDYRLSARQIIGWLEDEGWIITRRPAEGYADISVHGEKPGTRTIPIE